MTKGYGRKQLKMTNLQIVRKKGYVGKYFEQVNLFQVNNYRSMIFLPDNIGPIGCLQNEQQTSKYDTSIA